MINISELKVGSYVSFKGLWDGVVFKVSKSGFIEIEGNKGAFDDECIQPVDLTEEILLSMGFEKYKEVPAGYWKELDHFKLGKFHLQFEGKFSLKGLPIEPVIEYVHHLQNLYQSLTGEELTMDKPIHKRDIHPFMT